jgi:protein arginine N-methyltransferase 7
MGQNIEDMIARCEAALEGAEDYAFKLVGVAEAVALAKDPVRAVELARRAIAASPGDRATRMRARRLLGSLLPGYHVPMMNDARRNAAWDQALRAAVEPGMLVLDIGTGAGMLALMAARAGAFVVTCESNVAAASIARDLVRRNGLDERIRIVPKNSRALRVGVDLERPADLLVCDIFADELLTFDPLMVVQDARERLLRAGAPTIPAAVAFKVALARWDDYGRTGSVGRACGFDLEDFAGFVPAALQRPIDTPGLHMMSEAAEAFRFELAGPRVATTERRSTSLRITETGAANTLVRWIRLDLGPSTAIEARPEPGGTFFSGLTLAPLDQEEEVRRGETVTVGAFRQARTIDTWLEPFRPERA